MKTCDFRIDRMNVTDDEGRRRTYWFWRGTVPGHAVGGPTRTRKAALRKVAAAKRKHGCP